MKVTGTLVPGRGTGSQDGVQDSRRSREGAALRHVATGDTVAHVRSFRSAEGNSLLQIEDAKPGCRTETQSWQLQENAVDDKQ